MRRVPAALLGAALILSPVALSACSSSEAAPAVTATAPASAPAAPVRVDVDPWMAAALSPGTVIIDVRTPEEFASGHVQGAVNIPVEAADFAQQVGELDPGATYALYCRSGNRSAVATQMMGSMGFMHIYDLNGGFADLESAGMPTA